MVTENDKKPKRWDGDLCEEGWWAQLGSWAWARSPGLSYLGSSHVTGGFRDGSCHREHLLQPPQKKVAPREPSSVEKSSEKRWDVLGAVAFANGPNSEGASAAPPRSAAAGKEADLVGGTLSYGVNWISCSSSKCSSKLGLVALRRCTHHQLWKSFCSRASDYPCLLLYSAVFFFLIQIQCLAVY